MPSKDSFVIGMKLYFTKNLNSICFYSPSCHFLVMQIEFTLEGKKKEILLLACFSFTSLESTGYCGACAGGFALDSVKLFHGKKSRFLPVHRLSRQLRRECFDALRSELKKI